MKTIRWGIIGVGDVTEIKSGPAFYKSANSALVAVMRRSGDKAKDYAQRHGVSRWYDDGDALINDPEVDVVYIATPQYAHKDYTLKAAAAGKHVYSEKPMALNHSECQEMIAACKGAGVSLWVAYYRRAMRRFLRIKDFVRSGAIGEVKNVTITLLRPSRVKPNTPLSELHWHYLPEFSGGGQVLDVGCHQIDLMQHFFGSVVEVAGSARNAAGLYPAVDSANAEFRFESGVEGSARWSFVADENVDETVIAGSKGQIRFAVFEPTPVALQTDAGTQVFDLGYPQHVHQPLVETIIAELNGQGHCPSTGETAAQTSWVFDQLFTNAPVPPSATPPATPR